MAIRRLAHPLTPDCRQLWSEVGEIIKLCEGVIAKGENAGKDMSAYRESCEQFADWYRKIGMEYYPDDFASQQMS